MRRFVPVLLAGAAVAAVAVPGAGAAGSKRTKDFTFKSNGTAVSPSAVGDPNSPTSHEDFVFKVAPTDKDGSINVRVDWQNPADDWDLYVYRKGSNGQLQTVGSSAGGPPSTEEDAVSDGQGLPMKAGTYVIRVVNYAASVPNFTGSVRFGPYTAYNKAPVAKLEVTKHVKKGKKVKLDASKSRDPDGSIVNYSFDLDGNGSMETNNGTKPVLRRVLPVGVHHVAVRVRDNKGLRAYATRTVRVGTGH